ncbi:MAG TPA: amino acid adenylation domain-containing protein [Paucimonas sp.]|nr:amino acid adenylation domain-containing protein [Paucimonas sp.]
MNTISDAALARAVAAQARLAPEAIAVIDGDLRLDYAALDAAATRIAHALARRGLRAGQAVAVCLPRSWQLVAAMLGILKAGAVVVPIDRQSPAERVRHMLADSGSAVLLHADDAEAWLPEAAAGCGMQASPVGSLIEERADAELGLPEPAAPYSFIFYTSGTTGQPKGVLVADAGILRLARPGYIRIRRGDRYACCSNPAFDALSFEVWVPLLTGGCCVIFSDDEMQAPHRLAEKLRGSDIDTLFMTVSLFNAIVDRHPTCFSTVGQVLVGGEQLNAGVIRRWYRDNPASPTRIFNVYGPTECTTFALSYPIPRDFQGAVVPLGGGLPGTGMALIVDGTRPAEEGENAELYLSGEGLACGYRNLEQETARKFVRPSWPEEGRTRYYRTGDLVRRNGDGLIEYVGRIDRQVKVRGFRVEPEELERKILLHPAVKLAYVGVRYAESPGVNELHAYLVLQAELPFEEFARHLEATLPSYMHPHGIYLVDALPLNANGKVDKAALFARAIAPWRPHAAPVDCTPWQQIVLTLIGEILAAPDVHLHGTWISHGGDSLKALRLRFEVLRRWQCDLPQTAILRQTFEQLAAAIEAGKARSGSVYPALPPRQETVAPATSEQQRLWLLQQQNPSSTAYNVPLAFQIDGKVDPAALAEALRRVVRAFPALRTAFVADADGLLQAVAEPYDPCCFEAAAGCHDEASRMAFVRHIAATPFDLGNPRLLQAYWLPAAAEGGVLLLHTHHIAVDGWSLNVLFQALSAHYAAALAGTAADDADAAPTPLAFGRWQAEWTASEAYRDHRLALKAFYAAQENIEAPLTPMYPTAAFQGRLLREDIDAARRAALDRLGARMGLTRFQLLIGLYAFSIFAATGRAHPRIASPVTNRPIQAFDRSVGMFANTVLIPAHLDGQAELRAQLRQLAGAAQQVLERQEVLLADAVADLPQHSAAGGALFDFMFVLENTEFSALRLADCEARPLWLQPAQAKCPLSLSVVETADGMACLWEYAGDYFAEQEVRAMAEVFLRALDCAASESAVTLNALAQPCRRALPECGRGETAPLVFERIADWFAHQVRLTPQAVALVDRRRQVRYAELDAYAEALAGELVSRYGLRPERDEPCCVALYLEASVEHIVALVALARLNVTIVPLDPAYPERMLKQVLEQIDPACILVQEDRLEALARLDGAGAPRHVLSLDTLPAARALPAVRAATRPLYTLFTSGSTGVPKGVQVHDRTLCNLLQWQRDGGGMAASATTMQFSMLSFDVSFQEIFSTLCAGASLHLISPIWRQDAQALLRYLEQAKIQRIFMPYVALQMLAEHGVNARCYPSHLTEVVTAGEQLLCTDAIRRWFARLPQARLFNHYGPTETHVVSSLCLAGDPARWPGRPSIGRPIANAWLRVVDEWDQPVPAGCQGRLLIGGLMASPCYLGGEELNRARFVSLPGNGHDAEPTVFYRTGDLACFDRDGLLHFLERDDQQIKISGHRLELGQIEAALLQHPAVSNAAVVRDKAGGELIACLQCHGEAPTSEALQRHLAGLLPGYVKIHRFRLVPAMPRTASGKLDRRQILEAPGADLEPGMPARQHRLTALESRLSELFEAVIGRPIAPDQSFFDAGASSLGLMRYHLRCSAELSTPFTIPDLFEHVTIRRLARFLGERPGAAEAEPKPEPEPERAADDGQVAIVGMAVRLPGADDLAEFWEMVAAGRRGMTHFETEPGKVGARSQMNGLLAFDPDYFGISRQEARLMDPQQRHLLMCCVQALAHAGIGDTSAQCIGLVASCGENTYFQSMLTEGDPVQMPDGFQMALHHDKDFLATKVAYHLNLSGPALTVQAACASSLIAVHVAAGQLRQGDSDVMLVGGVLVDTLLSGGYRYRPQHIFSKDGHCRPFSDDASGTIGGSGVGVVVLKPLRRAIEDGDHVYAVLAGSAVNNDGADKLSYTAPSVAGQREVIRAALRRSGHAGRDIGYVEAHGTGTRLGDPIEVSALRQAFDVPEDNQCALASVKSQIGHLGAAAGVAGLIRAALAVYHGQIPPNVDFDRINAQIGERLSPFYIPTAATPWPPGRRRIAAVSSFGIGGTNAHVIVEQAPESAPRGTDLPCLLISGRSGAAVRQDAARIADYLSRHPATYPQVLRHLQAGRGAHRWRMAAVCRDAEEAIAWLRSAAPAEVPAREEARRASGAEGALSAAGLTPSALVAAWLNGDDLTWPAGPAPAPWNFPPPAFELADFDFARRPEASSEPPAQQAGLSKLPEAAWLHQRQWLRARRAGTETVKRTARTLVVLLDDPLPQEALRMLRRAYARVIEAVPRAAFARLAQDRYAVNPTDAQSIGQLLALCGGEGECEGGGIDWLHGLPLSVRGAVHEDSMQRAQWACLDSPAALLQAWAALPARLPAGSAQPALRAWWLSYRAQAVDGCVSRPELGLLCGANEVVPQELGVRCHWLDLPDADLARNLADILPLLAAPEALPRRLALRNGYLWQPALLPLRHEGEHEDDPLLDDDGTYVILGGSGGIGSSIAASLLARPRGRVILLSRTGGMPETLRQWADRVVPLAADLTDAGQYLRLLDRLQAQAPRIHGVIHAAGVAAGNLVVRRDAAAMRQGTRPKLQGALLVEALIRACKPRFAAYCSSMSALFGGVGQFDYAAANGVLDGFASYRASDDERTLRLSIDWDIWRDVGMAQRALQGNRQHRAHLALGLTPDEGTRVFLRALRLQLPQLLVSTTALAQARRFYEASADAAPPAEKPAGHGDMRDHLQACLCRWLGVDRLDEQASLYDLGADSLTLLDLVGELEARFGAKIALSQLSHKVSLAEILDLTHGRKRAGDDAAPVPLEVWQTGGSQNVLCLIHPVGGDIQAYRELVSLLDPSLTVCLIADPALSRPDAPQWSVAERARQYLAALRKDFPAGDWQWHLCGWSFGAWVAQAMGALAEAAGTPVSELYLIDPPPPGSGPHFAAYSEEQIEATFLHELRQRLPEAAQAMRPEPERGEAAPLAAEARRYVESLTRTCRRNLAGMAGFDVPRVAASASHVFVAVETVPDLPPALAAGAAHQALWQACSGRLVTWRRLETTHYGIMRKPHIDAVAEAINRHSVTATLAC